MTIIHLHQRCAHSQLIGRWEEEEEKTKKKEEKKRESLITVISEKLSLRLAEKFD